MDFHEYSFENLGLVPDDSKSFSDDDNLLSICWFDDGVHFLCIF